MRNPEFLRSIFFQESKLEEPSLTKFYQKGVDVVHTYSKNDRKSREEKENFRIGCAEICATTLHSFKGWEASHLVVNIESIVLDRDRALFILH